MTIGIIPCAGKAERMHGLPKYLLPVGDSYLLAILVKRMQAAGVRHVYIGANRENYDLVEKYAPEGCTVYLVNSKTMSETILAARKYAGDEDMLFGMPDTWWSNEYVFEGLNWCLNLPTHLADRTVATIALFDTRVNQRHLLGMVRTRGIGEVAEIVDKPSSTDLTKAWGAVIWSAQFWDYIDATHANFGLALQLAVNSAVSVKSVNMDGSYYDCGTPDEYFRLIRETTEVKDATL